MCVCVCVCVRACVRACVCVFYVFIGRDKNLLRHYLYIDRKA